MIECTTEYIYYDTFKRKNRREFRRRRRFFLFFAVVVLLATLFYHINGAIFNLISDICEDYAAAVAIGSVNQAVTESLSEQIKYSELIKIEKNNDGDITLMSSDALKINAISRKVAIATEKFLSEKLKSGIPVPMMAYSGIRLASGYGPITYYKAITIAGVGCEFCGKFSSVGINQTLHSLYVKINCTIDVEFLYKSRRCEISSEVLISEAVLVGKVPKVYLGGALFG